MLIERRKKGLGVSRICSQSHCVLLGSDEMVWCTGNRTLRPKAELWGEIKNVPRHGGEPEGLAMPWLPSQSSIPLQGLGRVTENDEKGGPESPNSLQFPPSHQSPAASPAGIETFALSLSTL